MKEEGSQVWQSDLSYRGRVGRQTYLPCLAPPPTPERYIGITTVQEQQGSPTSQTISKEVIALPEGSTKISFTPTTSKELCFLTGQETMKKGSHTESPKPLKMDISCQRSMKSKE